LRGGKKKKKANPTLDILDIPAVAELTLPGEAIVAHVFVATPILKEERGGGIPLPSLSRRPGPGKLGRGGDPVRRDEFRPGKKKYRPTITRFNAWLLLVS